LLAVDDSKTIRKVLEITFAGEEFNTVLAANADEALSLVRSNAPAVALVDAALGSVSGYDLCQQIKAQSPGTAVIVLSSKQQPYDKGRGGAAGADDFMDKPFDTQQLIDKVKTVAKNAASRAPAAVPQPVAAPVQAVPVAPAQAAPAAPDASRSPMRAQTLAYGQSPSPPAAAATPRAVAAPAPAPAPAPAAAVASSAANSVVGDGQLAQALEGLGLSSEQVQGVLALSRDVVERVVWEVVPTLAEALIKEELQRLTSE
jgi:CheY-like chemotaxis protein